MRKNLILWAFLVAGLAAAVVQAKSNKVDILHKGKVISVSENAVQAHLNHGDVRCDSAGDPCGTGGGGGIGGGGATGAI